MDWQVITGILAIIGSIILAIGGLIKNRGDVKVGVRSATREDQAAWDTRYQSILDEVQESLVQPLREEVARLRAEVQQLRVDLQQERTDLREERARYRSALSHIRDWKAWGVLNAAHDAEPIPVPHERIVDDLH